MEQLAQDIGCVNNAMVARTGNHGKHCLGVLNTNRKCPRNKQGGVIWLNKNSAKCNIVFLYLLVREAVHSYKSLLGLGWKFSCLTFSTQKVAPDGWKKRQTTFKDNFLESAGSPEVRESY